MTFLQQIGAKSPPDKSKMTRQTTLETAFARVNPRNNVKDASSTPSLTTGTSQTEDSSELNDESLKLEDACRSSNRSRPSFGSYNESFLSKSTSKGNKARRGDTRVISGSTTLVGAIDSKEELMHEHLQGSDDDVKVSLDSRSYRPTSVKQTRSPKRAPTRASILHKVSSSMSKAKITLGKRARGGINDDEDDSAAIYGIKSSRLRSREFKPDPEPIQEPARKKARFTESATKSLSPEPAVKRKAAKKPRKIWLSQGLYVGQERDFDARLTESENKAKKTKVIPATAQRKPFMPLPMFAGQRLLEQGRNFKLPFSVFSPLPPGQPKPDEWKKTQKSK